MNPDHQPGYNPPPQDPNSPQQGIPNPYLAAVSDSAIANQELKPVKKRNNMLIIILSVVGVLVLLVIVLVILTSGKKAPVTNNKDNGSDLSQSQVLEPANALSTEFINDSIGQDIGGLNDEQDLPPTKINDKALGL